jgi:hypothetical protein
VSPLLSPALTAKNNEIKQALKARIMRTGRGADSSAQRCKTKK